MQPQPQQQQQPYAYPQEGYPQYDPNQQAGYTPQYDPNQQAGYTPQYDPNQQTGYAPQYDPCQQTGYTPRDPYQQQPPPAYPVTGGWQYKLNEYTAKAKQIILTTNPVYFLILGVLVIGIAGFLAFAYQTGLIKAGVTDTKQQGPTDKTPPVITMITVKAGQGNSALISWVTDEYSSTQVQWGVYPAPNQLTIVKNDPTTGQNMGVLIHEIAITPLAVKTTYQYRVISVDKYGNKAVSPSMTSPPMEFTTTTQFQ